MNENGAIITRSENILKLADCCGDLLRAFLRVGYSPHEIVALWRRGLAAECGECRIKLHGDELYALALPPDPEHGSAKLDRMRQGYCARKGCQGWTYTVEFRPLPQVDWARMLSESSTIREELSGKTVRNQLHWKIGWKIGMSPAVRRGALAVGVILVLLFAREWRIGGHMPLVRQPEKFHVDIGPE